MATLGTALMGQIYGHTPAEKMFRPLSDNVEDFMIYGLIMLGLIVMPTAIINSTPLYCTLCKNEGHCGNRTIADADPGYHINWVKTYCNQAAVKPFTIYFPYILLLSALVLLAFERFFQRIFKSTMLIESFHSLLTRTEEEAVEDKSADMENTIHCVEVSHVM